MKSVFFISGAIISLGAASVFARRIPDVISFDKERVMEVRRQRKLAKEREERKEKEKETEKDSHKCRETKG